MVTAFICSAAILGVALAFVLDLRNIRKIERLQEALKEANGQNKLLSSENAWLSTHRNELLTENASMKKAASKMVMQLAETFGKEVTNPKRENQ